MTYDFGVSYTPPEFDPCELPARLKPAIEAARDKADSIRRLPAGLVDELRKSGVFRLLTPVELGGFEVQVSVAIEILEKLGRIDGPTAWVIWNGNIGLSAAMLPASGSARIWAGGPNQIIVNSTAPGIAVPTVGGFALSGNWPVVSGVDVADWAALFGIVLEGDQPRLNEDGAPDVRLFMVPRSDLTVVDTWDVSGMRGTGSNGVVLDGLFVPAELSGELEKPMSIDRPLYRIPSFSIVAPGGAAIVLGMARAALDEVVSLAAAKIAAGNPEFAQRASVQRALGRADAELRAARLLLLDCAADLDRAAAAGQPVTDQERGALREAMSHANLIGRKVLTSMYELGGSTSLYRASRLERIVRDGLAAAQHTNNSAVHFELAGQLLLGLTPESPVY